jgi:hypothetical protein
VPETVRRDDSVDLQVDRRSAGTKVRRRQKRKVTSGLRVLRRPGMRAPTNPVSIRGRIEFGFVRCGVGQFENLNLFPEGAGVATYELVWKRDARGILGSLRIPTSAQSP